MIIFGRDIYITTRNPQDAAADARPFISWNQGWTVDDTEIYIGRWEIIVSKLASTAPVTADIARN